MFLWTGCSFLRVLMPLLDKHERAFLEKVKKAKAEWQKLMEERGTREDMPMKPQVIGWELGKRVPATAIVTSDSETITTVVGRICSRTPGDISASARGKVLATIGLIAPDSSRETIALRSPFRPRVCCNRETTILRDRTWT